MAPPVDPARLVLFLGVMAVLAVTPGPAVLFSISNGVARGARGVAEGVTGILAGSLGWFAAAGLGLGALMAAAPWLFSVLAWFGVAYLVGLGGGKLLAAWRGGVAGPGRGRVGNGRSAFLDGVTVQLANPKMVLFFSSILPPFLDVRRPLPSQLAILAVAALATDAVGLAGYGLGGAALARRLSSPRGARMFTAVSGGLLLGAAGLVALTRR